MRRSFRAAALALAFGAFAAARPMSATASDQASLQFTVPAPDPVQAGDAISLQALAVNIGSGQWAAGSYYWYAEIYDVEYRFVAKTDQISPTENVPPGAVAAISIPFNVPATATGRRFYRVFLVKDNKELLESDYKAFQIVEKPVPPPPESVDYRVSGNVTVSLKDSSAQRWKTPNGSTAVNLVGKIKDSSYLLNANLIHQPGKVVDPYSFLFSYYAPWGRIYAGDISPTYSQLSVNGVGLRGLMLEQEKGILDWSVLGGQSVTSQAGTVATNGRFARSIYAARLGIALPGSLKVGFNAFQSADEIGSLSSDPKSSNYRGPSLVPQKNEGVGANVTWKPSKAFTLLGDYQKNNYWADTGKPGVSDAAQRVELRLEKSLFKLKAYYQRTGPKFVTFAAPSVVGDRNTYDGTLSIFPASWDTLNLSVDQYTDNLNKDPNKLTTTQRVVNAGNNLHLPSGTDINVTGSMNTAKGKPATALDNRTVTEGLAITQAVDKHTFSANVQSSQFRDKNALAHDLDTQTFGLNANLNLPHNAIASLGGTLSQAKDKIDGSKRTSQSGSASYSRHLWPDWTGQLFGTLTTTKNTSPLFPSDTSTLSANTELTWNIEKQMSWTYGVGYNRTQDKIQAVNSTKEIVLSTRFSYSF